jgi:peptidoglycan/LPS O-acetylase OafA/YrhL
MSQTDRLALIDWIKALASQLIVWHHLAFYGPMSDTVWPHAPALMDWLYSYARIAVQAFLVAGGFLAARSLERSTVALPRLLGRRYLRLIRPYLAALVCAVAAGWLARSICAHADVPPPPLPAQLAAHVVLLQDVLGLGSVSAGMWYVAIDFQLFALLALIVRGARSRAWLPCALLGSASLFYFNRRPDLDVWAVYFFGSYSLGVLVAWLPQGARRWLAATAILAVVAEALIVEWRTRIAVAAVTALLLSLPLRLPRPAWVAWLAVNSYAVFLIHYPVLVASGAVVHRWWPSDAGANAAGMAAAWLLSLAAGSLLHRWTETPSPPAAAPAPPLPPPSPAPGDLRPSPQRS